MWGDGSYVGRNFDVASIWRTYADHVTAAPLPCDHYLPEEVPDETAQSLLNFFSQELQP